MKGNSQAAGQASTLGKQAHCAQQRSHHSDSSSQPAAWADSDSKQATWTTTAPQTKSQSPAAEIRQISPSSQQSQRRRTGTATQHGTRIRTEGGSGRAPSKHGRAAHTRRGHEHDAETRPRTLGRPGEASTWAVYTQLSSLYTQKQHPHAAKQKHSCNPTKKAQHTQETTEPTKTERDDRTREPRRQPPFTRLLRTKTGHRLRDRRSFTHTRPDGSAPVAPAAHVNDQRRSTICEGRVPRCAPNNATESDII